MDEGEGRREGGTEEEMGKEGCKNGAESPSENLPCL